MAKLSETALAPRMEAACYTKLRLQWHRRGPSVIRVLAADRSRWSDTYNLDLPLYLRGLGTEDKPPARCCQVRLDLSRLAPEPERFRRWLDFEDRSADEVRLGGIADVVARRGLPWLEAHCEDEEAVARLVVSNPTTPLAWIDARRYLSERFPAHFESAQGWARPSSAPD
jgi:hypothetical protein